MAAPNIVGVTTILGSTDALAVPDSATNIVLNASASGKVIKINSLVISNVDSAGGSSQSITVDYIKAGTAYSIANLIPIPVTASFVAVSKETGLYLEEAESLRLVAGANGVIEAVCSYEEIS